VTHATDTPRDDGAGDWQDRLIAAAATVTIGPRSTSEPIRLERLPSWINFDGIIDVEAAERRFELARQGRAFLPALAAWKREVLGLARAFALTSERRRDRLALNGHRGAALPSPPTGPEEAP
jgi:hypothetical protein